MTNYLYIQKILKFVSFLILSFIILTLLFSCANVGTLTGGDKDSIPPKMLASLPQDKGTNFKGQKFILQFDEFFQLSGLEETFIASPPLKKKPKFSIKKKNLIIKIDEELQDTTTYSFSFGEAIEDFHEGNPMKNFKFVFSTGEYVDSFLIAGKVINSFNQNSSEKMTVMLYRNWRDSTPILDTPYYVTKTDTAGFFDFDFIKPGKYRIFAVQDVDENYLFNLPNEDIAFLDSFIVPKVITKIKTDTLKAGTFILKQNKKNKLDTLILEKDSVVITKQNFYKPDSLILTSFSEVIERQYLKKSERLSKWKLQFVYQKKLDTILLNCTNPNFSLDKTIIEKSTNSDTIIMWLPDTNIYKIDTLNFTSSIYNLDSLENFKIETDTVEMFQKIKREAKSKVNKRAKIILDTIPKKEYLQLIFPKGEQGVNTMFRLETENPINTFDTSKIELFEIIDTAFVDPKIQNILTASKIQNNMLLFVFNRPVKDIKLRLLNYWHPEIWYNAEYNLKRDSVFCKITDEKVVDIDSLKFFIDYDNDYFFNQVQKFSDSLTVSISKQTFLSAKRETKSLIKFDFSKPVSKKPEIICTDSENKNFFETKFSDKSGTVSLKINDEKYKNKDTLSFIFKMYDYTDSTGNEIFFTDTITTEYKPEKQAITDVSRKTAKEITFLFKKPLIKDFNLTPLNFDNDKNLKISINNTKDTVVYSFSEKKIYSKDSLKFAVSYDYLNKNEFIVTKYDTIVAVYDKKNHTNSTNEGPPKIKVKVEMPVKYKLTTDSTTIRKYYIDYPWKPGFSYKAEIDSFAFEDVFELYNKKISNEFKVRTLESYGKIKLNMSDIAQIAEDNFFSNKNIADSADLAVLNSGQIIVELSDETEKIVRRFFITQNIDTTLEYINQGKYNLKIIYDKNSNEKWDTGDFLENNQPEKVAVYPGTIEVKEDFTTELIWKIRFKDLMRRNPKKK